MKRDTWTKAYESACADPRLNARDFRVFIAVRLRTGDEGACWESVETIGQRAGDMSGRSVQRSLDVLKKYGYLVEIPDLRKKTHRRFVLAKSVVPPPTDLVGTPDRTVVPPPTVLSPNQDQGSRSGSRPTMKTKRGESSSSFEALPGGEGEKAQGERPVETEAEQDARIDAEDALAMTFPGSPKALMKSTILEFGAENVTHAAKVYRPSGRKNEWGWFVGICRKTRDQGGPPGEPRKILPSLTRHMTYFTGSPKPTYADELESRRQDFRDGFAARKARKDAEDEGV